MVVRVVGRTLGPTTVQSEGLVAGISPQARKQGSVKS